MGCGKSKQSKKQDPEVATLAPKDEEQPEKPAPRSPEKTLKVEILSARGLRAGDFLGTSQPYCTVEMAGKPKSRCSTGQAGNCAEKPSAPWWRETLEVKGCQAGDEMVFTVYDKDPIVGDDVLGTITLSAEQVKAGFIGELQLLETDRVLSRKGICVGKGNNVEAFLLVKVEGMDPTVEDTAWYGALATKYASGVPLAISNSVKVEIVEARGLRNADWVGKQQPYITCEIEGKPKTRSTSALGDNPKDPKWNHTAQVGGYQLGDALVLTVWDMDIGKPDDMLGTATLTADQVKAGFVGEVQLMSAGRNVEAFVVVKVVGKDPSLGDHAEEAMLQAAEAMGYDRRAANSARVEVISARGMRNCLEEKAGLATKPYVIVQVADKDGAIKDGSRFVTEAAKDLENAEWKHKMNVAGCNVGDSLVFTVKDSDVGHDSTAQDLVNGLLGRATLSADLVKSGYFGELQLEQAGYNAQAFIKVHVEGRDPNPADLSWMAAAVAADGSGQKPAVRNSCKVEIINAHGLRDDDWMEVSEPYCMVQVAGKGERWSRWGTPQATNWKDPEWNHEMQVACQPGDALEFIVKDHDQATLDGTLGKATLSADKVKEGFVGELELENTGKKAGAKKAVLKVRVEGSEFSVVDRTILEVKTAQVVIETEVKETCCGIR